MYALDRAGLVPLFAAFALVPMASGAAQENQKPATARAVDNKEELLANAERLNQRVGALYQAGKYREAIAPARQALDIRKKALGEDHPHYAATVNNLALLYFSMGDYAKAEPLFRQALAIEKKALGEDHPLYATSLINLAALYSALGDYAKAEPLFRQALAIEKKALGEDHPEYATGLSNVAELYFSLNDYARAEPLCRQVLAIRKKALGEDHPLYASSVNNLALLYFSMGDYAKAEPLYKQASDIWKTALGEANPLYADSLNNLAGLHQATGDYAKAEPLFKQALEIRKNALGDSHPAYATSLNNLAQLYEELRDYAKAEPLHRRALEIRRKALGKAHPHYATSLNNLGELYYLTGDYARAERLFKQASEVLQKALGQASPAYAETIGNLAFLYDSTGDYAKAEPLYLQASEIIKKSLGEAHPDYATCLDNLAGLYVAKGTAERGEPLARAALQKSRDLLERTAAVQSERQQFRSIEMLRFRLDDYLSAVAAAGPATADAYGFVLGWKSSVLSRQQTLRALQWARQVDSSKEVVTLAQNLTDASRRLASLCRASPDRRKPGELPRLLHEASERIEELERALAAASPQYRRQLDQRKQTPKDLRAALPDEAALVDFLEYSRYTVAAKGKRTRERRLTAFVLRRDRDVAWIDLGPAEPITTAVDTWRRTIGQGSEAAHAAADLRRLVWAPFRAHLQDIKTVLVSPDGALNRFPLAAMPGQAEGSYLVEDVAIAIIPVPQMLPELVAQKPGAASPSLLVVGNVDYGPEGDRGGPYPSLPGTVEEMLLAQKRFRGRFPDGQVTPVELDKATKSAMYAALPKARWAHLATHGYFADEKVVSAMASDNRRGAMRLGRDGPGPDFVGGMHPGLLSGLVLAGANKPPADDPGAGILTALEVAALDLSNLDTAVLSACNTGRGREAAGEGVLSLQRAFQVAGARTVVASLWSVPDRETRELMGVFYDNLWAKGLPKLEALRQAQLTLLRQGNTPTGPAGRRDLGATPEPLGSAARCQPRRDPALWAAFVLSGDWR